jgi:hypothetical protein
MDFRIRPEKLDGFGNPSYATQDFGRIAPPVRAQKKGLPQFRCHENWDSPYVERWRSAACRRV